MTVNGASTGPAPHEITTPSARGQDSVVQQEAGLPPGMAGSVRPPAVGCGSCLAAIRVE